MADDFKGMNWDKKIEHEKSAVRCKVEHLFLIVKRQGRRYNRVITHTLCSNRQQGIKQGCHRGVPLIQDTMMMLFLSKESSLESSIWKSSPLFVNLNGSMSTLPSDEIAEVK